MIGALQGIKVLDFTQVYSGPFCTLMLKDLGAEIIKVERTGSGDIIRQDAPLTEGGESGTFIILNRGKKSITLDIKSEQGRSICRDLAAKVDVLVENFSPGTMDKLGLGNRDLCKVNPRLIYASISAYGQYGPRRDFAGYDPVAQALGGLTSVSGPPEGPPTKCAVAIADFSTGLFTASAILAALFHRSRTGEGQTIDISLQECVWQFTSIEFSPIYFLTGKNPPRLGNGHPAMAPGNTYPAKDGWVIISTGVLSQVRRLYSVMGREDLFDTPLCANQKIRYQHKEEIDALVADWTKKQNADDIVKALRAIDVPCARVPSFAEVCNDAQLLSRNMIIDVDQPISGKVKVPGSVYKMSRTPGNINYPAPYLGENNEEVYSELLGYSKNDIERLSNTGVI
jgi:crotonobetainyl-CoA:carnitine CoA-transferase CaiB-like acyl-CoA transferase